MSIKTREGNKSLTYCAACSACSSPACVFSGRSVCSRDRAEVRDQQSSPSHMKTRSSQYKQSKSNLNPIWIQILIFIDYLIKPCIFYRVHQLIGRRWLRLCTAVLQQNHMFKPDDKENHSGFQLWKVRWSQRWVKLEETAELVVRAKVQVSFHVLLVHRW